MSTKIQKLTRPKKIETGYFLNYDACSFFSIVIPEESTNLVWNPDTRNLSGYATFAPANMFIDEDVSRRAYSSIRAEGGGGVCYRSFVTPVTGEPYTFSFDHRGLGTYQARIFVGGVELIAQPFEGYTWWQRHEVTITIANAALLVGTFDLCVTTLGHAETFHVDGFQFENKPYATTYIDGDQKGFLLNENIPPYSWQNDPYVSPSTRRASTNSGGRKVRLDEFGVEILSFFNLGAPPTNHTTVALGIGSGSKIIGSRSDERRFSIVGEICNKDLHSLLCERLALIMATTYHRGSCPQELLLCFQPYLCNDPTGECVEFKALYQDGLNGSYQSLFRERISIEFLAPDPFIYQCGNSADTLTLVMDIPNAEGILCQDPEGNWQALIDSNGDQLPLPTIEDTAVGPDGVLYMVGNITSVGGGLANVMGWNGVDFVEIGSITGAPVVIESGFDNKLYIGGVITQAFPVLAPVVPLGNITCYDVGGAFDNLDTTVIGGPVTALKVSQDGRLYVGGTFATITNTTTGVLNTNNIACYDPRTNLWTALGPGLGGLADQILDIEVKPDGTIYAAGDFSDGVPNADPHNIARFNTVTNTWDYIDPPSLAGVPAPALVSALQCATDGSLYAGGTFDSTFAQFAGGGLNNIARLDSGDVWFDMDQGVIDPPGPPLSQVNDIALRPDGSLVVVGRFDTAGSDGLFAPAVAVWNGSSWSTLGIEIPPPYTLSDVSIGPDGSIYISGAFNGVATSAAPTEIDIGCAIDTKPVIRITGPGQIQNITNATNGSSIDFVFTGTTDNIQPSEIVTIDLTDGAPVAVSNVTGVRTDLVASSSLLSLFSLSTGRNVIQVLMDNLIVNSQVRFEYKRKFLSVDAACTEDIC